MGPSTPTAGATALGAGTRRPGRPRAGRARGRGAPDQLDRTPVHEGVDGGPDAVVERRAARHARPDGPRSRSPGRLRPARLLPPTPRSWRWSRARACGSSRETAPSCVRSRQAHRGHGAHEQERGQHDCLSGLGVDQQRVEHAVGRGRQASFANDAGAGLPVVMGVGSFRGAVGGGARARSGCGRVHP